MGSARSVFLTSQDFGGPKIRRLLEGFLAKGGRLRLLLDDDWFYVRFLGERFGMADYEFAVGWILRTQRRYPSTFEVRYLETDNTAEFQTSLHHKFIIFQGGSRDAVLFGSPNLKDGALLKNIENVYVVRDSDVVRRFVQFAEDSWSKALPDLEMPIVDSNQFR
ncbi:phospholipase D-like domain-containing protein [Bradyrhizobium elkanii]|uniref:phospholipase D-like domain-containing protein n=1 Tax=Bradyrhizobium elkanii TaxID=29448 RepID=UPI001F0A33DE|nr:phospholipase D-like domain-containing protein [Bradyrhizobium elkanii]